MGAFLVLGTPAVFAQTWDGGGNNNNWTTAANWNFDTVPGASPTVSFGGTSRTSVNVDVAVSPYSVTFASGAGAFTLSGQTLTLGAGGATNNSSNTQTIGNQLSLSAAQTWTAATAPLTFTGYVGANSQNLTLAGDYAVTVNGQLNSLGNLTLNGAGNRTFANSSGFAANNVVISNTGTNTFAGQLNAESLTIHSGTTSFNNTGTSAQIGSGGMLIDGSAQVTFAKNVGTSGTFTVSGSASATLNGSLTSSTTLTLNTSGNVAFHGSQINAGQTNVSGTGTILFDSKFSNGAYNQSGANVTFTGNGTNNFSSFNVTGGSLLLDVSAGIAVNTGQVNVSNATLSFGENNQFNQSWTDIVLGDGAVLNLTNTTQSIDQLVIAGNALIDFGTGSSTFDINSISFNSGSTLTVVNWNNSVDSFYADLAPGSSLPQVIFQNSDGTYSGSWGGGSITPGSPSAPVPEPATAGLLVLGGLTGFALVRRRRHANPASIR